MSETCIFCRIARGEMGTELLHEDDEVVAFRDLNPQAPTHVLVIPRRHIEGVDHLHDSDGALAGRLVTAARSLAATLGLATGYRLVLNSGVDGGQSVSHLHLHLLGGRPMTWPPG